MEDLVNTFKNQFKGLHGAGLSLLVETKFTRDNPSDAKIAKGKQKRVLNVSLEDDCQTMKQIEALAAIDCVENEFGFQNILF